MFWYRKTVFNENANTKVSFIIFKPALGGPVFTVRMAKTEPLNSERVNFAVLDDYVYSFYLYLAVRTRGAN